MSFVQRSFRDAEGCIVIRSRLGPGLTRRGFERLMFPGIEVGLAGWQRAHSQGAGTGFESPHAIRYAPEAVNQRYQRLGIERYLRDLMFLKPGNVDLWLTTVTCTHWGTLRLSEIQYRVDELPAGQTGRAQARRLLEASITVSNDRDNPRIGGSVTPYLLYQSRVAAQPPGASSPRPGGRGLLRGLQRGLGQRSAR